MVNRRRRNGATARSRTTSNRRVGKMISRMTAGYRITPSTDPPEYTAGPWWPMTVIITTSGDTQVTAAGLYENVLDQLTWTAYVDKTAKTVPLELRVLSIRSWGLNKQPIQLTIYDHLGGKHRLKEMSDYGTPLNYSRVGWKFGTIGTNDALLISDTDVIFEVTSGGTDKVLNYVQVLIRTSNAPKPVLKMIDAAALTTDFAML